MQNRIAYFYCCYNYYYRVIIISIIVGLNLATKRYDIMKSLYKWRS